jgi:FKBP-type peptidyl-prolyl cis-trans isomerase (trigger factor)
MKFNLTFTQEQIKPAKQKALTSIATNLTLKGFRKGKAPIDLVEQSVDQEKLLEETISHLIPESYTTYINEHDLKPITQPKISLSKMVNDGDWEFEIEIAEKPEVKLNKYLDAIKGEKAKDTIWTPEKGASEVGDKEHPHDHENEDKKLTLIFDTLLKTCEVEIPELLIEEEANRALSRLVEQVNKLGLKIEQYLDSIGKKPEEIRDEYKKTSTDNLRLEFILDAIAKDQKVDATDADIEEFLKNVDTTVAEEVKKRPMEMASLKYSIIKHKVVDLLLAA